MERGRKEPSSEMVAAVAGELESSLLELTAGSADALREREHGVSAERSSVRVAFALAA